MIISKPYLYYRDLFWLWNDSTYTDLPQLKRHKNDPQLLQPPPPPPLPKLRKNASDKLDM